LGLFWKADEAFSEEFKKVVSNRLKRMDFERATAGWPGAFTRLFDRLFGKRHLSWHCFLRSCIASSISVLLLTLITLTFNQELFVMVMEFKELFIFFPLGAFVFNFLPDYVSLIETRYVLKWMSTHSSNWTLGALLLFDVFATFLIFWAFGLVGSSIFISASEGGLYILNVSEFLELVHFAIWPGGDVDGSMYAVFFYSTFITSIWAWLYASSEAAVRLAMRFRNGVRILQWALPIETKPFRSIGEVAALFVCVSYWVIAGIASLLQQTA